MLFPKALVLALTLLEVLELDSGDFLIWLDLVNLTKMLDELLLGPVRMTFLGQVIRLDLIELFSGDSGYLNLADDLDGFAFLESKGLLGCDQDSIWLKSLPVESSCDRLGLIEDWL